MRGLGKFLFGGVLGAIFGFLVSPKRAQRVREALFSEEDRPGVPDLQPPLLSVRSATAEPILGESETEAWIRPEPRQEETLRPEPTRSTPQVSITAPEPASESAPTPEPAPAPTPEPEAAAESEPEAAPEPEPEAAPEPVVTPAPEPEPEPAPVAETEPVPEPAPVPTPEPTATAEPVQPLERTWPEPEAPELEIQGPGSSTPEAVEAAPVFSVAARVPDEEPVESLEEAEESETEHSEVEWRIPHKEEPEASLEWIAPSEPEAEVTTEETILPTPQAPVTDQPVGGSGWLAPETKAAGASTQPDAADISDLKARIEETRRRIQRELDQPFVSERTGAEDATEEEVDVVRRVDAVSPEPASPTEAPPTEAPPAEPAPTTEPAPSTEPAPMFEPATFTETGEADVTVDLEAPSEPSSAPLLEAESSTEAGSAFDHGAMRRRIEETRSRLKAKAFDAMMKGESALLARDEEGEVEEPAEPADAPMDHEVAETIDSALSEEDI